MATFVNVIYTATATGGAPAALKTAMQQPPTLGGAGVLVPVAMLTQQGLRVTSDTTTATGTGANRNIQIALGPSATATATAVLARDATLASVTVGSAGEDYVLPPVISFTGGGVGGANLVYGPEGNGEQYPKAIAYLNVQAAAIVYAGTTYSNQTTLAFIGGLPPAIFPVQPQDTRYWSTPGAAALPTPNGPPYAVNSLNLVTSGNSYSNQTYLLFEGPLQPGGHQAIAVSTNIGPNGQILGIELVDPGQGYLDVATVSIIDPVSTTPPTSENRIPAAITTNMGAGTPATATLTIDGLTGEITGIAGLTPGSGYVQPPTMVIYDPTGAGSGGELTARMGVGAIDVTYKGRGLSTVPTVVLTPFFKSLFPDASDQKVPFYNFPMYQLLKAAIACEIVPATPMLS
jgi:hypothetical protein